MPRRGNEHPGGVAVDASRLSTCDGGAGWIPRSHRGGNSRGAEHERAANHSADPRLVVSQSSDDEKISVGGRLWPERGIDQLTLSNTVVEIDPLLDKPAHF